MLQTHGHSRCRFTATCRQLAATPDFKEPYAAYRLRHLYVAILVYMHCNGGEHHSRMRPREHTCELPAACACAFHACCFVRCMLLPTVYATQLCSCTAQLHAAVTHPQQQPCSKPLWHVETDCCVARSGLTQAAAYEEWSTAA
jgi:hypothetical protein